MFVRPIPTEYLVIFSRYSKYIFLVLRIFVSMFDFTNEITEQKKDDLENY